MLRYGLIGLGSMGRHHARNIRALDGVELVGVADPFGDKFGVAGDLPVFEDFRALIDLDLDAAVVAVPTAQHAQVAIALAEAGINTLVEKPLASTLDEGEAMVEAFESRNLVGAVGYVERCSPALMELRKRIQEGQLGKIYQIVTHRQSPFPARIADVGVVKDLATHDIDLTAWVAGSAYDTLFAQTASQAGRDYEDLVSVSGKLENGVIVNHLVNWLSPFKERTTTVLGENGALVAETVMSDLTFHENGQALLEWDHLSSFRGVSEGASIKYAIQKREPLAVEHENFRNAILGTGTDHVTMREALKTMKVIQTILDSAGSGVALQLND
ncbi:Gfo/Idh/MocA family oxidoreductase [Corynebacterium phoceense]|uniref:Gfo/Idh/MocA family protein n=1 Tax=Corynebacterium phoceense TaxID=1686286 RepID=UPI00211C9CBF|nr:Gfo/Idh/MocA family oxidoreductase [Corynebacterium phoceense]MCQ9335073.1 Gfo/Idh/MocA family oxidoreductase [Corynebacterium phoceense]